MKTIRHVLVILFSILIFISAILFCATTLSQSLFAKDLTKSIVENINIDEPINAALSKFDPQTREAVLNESGKLKETIVNNEQFTQAIQQYGEAFIGSILNENSVTPDINQEARNAITAHENDIKEVIGTNLNETQKDQLIQGISENLNLQPYYNRIVDKVKQQITPKQQSALTLLQTLTNPSLTTLALGMMIVSILGIIVCKMSVYRWLFAPSLSFSFAGISLWIGSKIVPSILGDIITTMNSLLGGFTTAIFSQLANFAYIYIGIGIVGMILYYTLKHFLPNQN
ncbi:MAG: hypothetical protein RSF69_05865 [Erysipelotrichaceae bacterium]